MGKKSNKRPWRKLVKKFQRKRKRQKVAREKDKLLEEEKLQEMKNPLYKSWLEFKEQEEQNDYLAKEKERQEQEDLWLRREQLAQKQFQREEQKRKALEAEKEAERLQQEIELEKQQEAWQKKRDNLIKQSQKAAKEFEDTMDLMEKYLENSDIKTPTYLEKYVETRPGEQLCGFYEKTNCCRFGPGCTFNHKRPMLAKIIVIRHFFQHPLLEKQEHEEYATGDSDLELTECDLKESYDEFCEDVWPVMENFGKMINFRTIRNTQSHLRGHVFVEFQDKRSALRAFINLQKRFYASKCLNVEFSNLRQWRNGVCGMLSFLKGIALNRNCSKGAKCNYLHLMKNAQNKYNMPMGSSVRTPQSSIHNSKANEDTPLLSWKSIDTSESKRALSRNWRWSESPEVELKTRNRMEDTNKLCENNDPKGQSQSEEKTTSSHHYGSKRSKSPSTKRYKSNKQEIEDKSKSNHHKHHRNQSKSPSKEHRAKQTERYTSNRQEIEYKCSENNRSPSNIQDQSQSEEKLTNSHNHKRKISKSPTSKRHKSNRQDIEDKKSNHHKSHQNTSKSPSEEHRAKHKKSKKHHRLKK